RHTRSNRDWSSDVCSSDLVTLVAKPGRSTVADLVAAGAEKARHSPFAAHLPSGDPAGICEVRQNRAAVQDEASQLVTLASTRVEIGRASCRGRRMRMSITA